MRAYHPSDGGADPGREPTRDDLDRRVRALLAEVGGGRRCPVCDGQMAHYRLWGYRCLRGCNPGEPKR